MNHVQCIHTTPYTNAPLDVRQIELAKNQESLVAAKPNCSQATLVSLVDSGVNPLVGVTVIAAIQRMPPVLLPRGGLGWGLLVATRPSVPRGGLGWR